MTFVATPEAVDAIKSVLAQRGPDAGPETVRVMVAHQCGCGTTKFQMGFDDREEGDNELVFGGITLLMDPVAAQALEGGRLEVVHSDNLMVPQFNIATAATGGGGGCGCGGHGHQH